VRIARGLWVGAWLLLAQMAHADTVYVVRRGWHIDVGFDVPELVAPLASVAREFPGARCLLFGFGDRRYLMAKHSHVPAMLGAIWPGEALVLVTGLTATPAEAFGQKQVIALDVSPSQSRELQAFIAHSLRTTDGSGLEGSARTVGSAGAAMPQGADGALGTGRFAVAAPGPYSGSLFYSSDLKYSGVHTCNTWVAEGLRSAQLPVRSRGTLFAGQLWRQVTRVADESHVRQ
jgi:hypothetical protein